MGGVRFAAGPLETFVYELGVLEYVYALAIVAVNIADRDNPADSGPNLRANRERSEGQRE